VTQIDAVVYAGVGTFLRFLT